MWKGEFTFDTAPPLGSDVEHVTKCVSPYICHTRSSPPRTFSIRSLLHFSLYCLDSATSTY